MNSRGRWVVRRRRFLQLCLLLLCCLLLATLPVGRGYRWQRPQRALSAEKHVVMTAAEKPLVVTAATSLRERQPVTSLPRTTEAALKTYDDIIRSEISREQYTQSGEPADLSRLPCDPVTVPFPTESTSKCQKYLACVMRAAVQELPRGVTSRLNLSIAWPEDRAWEEVVFTLEPMEQRSEQRTIKFKLTVASRTEPSLPSVEAILKVPQALFPVEPFSEAGAFHLDRQLGINRIPPTVFLEVPVAWVVTMSKKRSQQKMKMVPEFLVASHVRSYDEWIEHDFVGFVSKERTHRFVVNSTWCYASVQLYLWEVLPTLNTPFHVPYSKRNPGWHRWFNPEYNGTRASLGPLLALSELSVFDFITGNDDRSPNKNNFVVGTCNKCSPRRPSGLAPTFVHLDQGMTFYSEGQLIHNPLAKPAPKVSFCIFYAPLVRSLRQLVERAKATHGSADVEASVQRVLTESLDPRVATVLGHPLLACGRKVLKVLARVDTCLAKFRKDVVLQP